ncbi:MAG: hypothetical protein ACTHKG_10070 [Nocardioides sp.]
MADRTLDLQTALSGLRRHRGVLLVAALLGCLLGIGSAMAWPPMYVSSSLVLMPIRAADPDQMAELVKTDTRVAVSDAVLGRAARSLRPPISVADLGRHVEVTPATLLILEVTGKAETPERAEAIARAVANADVAFVTESASSLSDKRRAVMTTREKELKATLAQVDEQIAATNARQQDADPRSAESKSDATILAKLTAQKGTLALEINDLRSQREEVQPSGGGTIIQEPSPAERAGLVGRAVAAALAGALMAAILAAGIVMMLTGRNRRLIFRDDIADAVGSPVVASVHTRVRDSVASWVALLRDHLPTPVEAWAWRQALLQLRLTAPAVGAQRGRDRNDRPPALAVVTLSSDPRGLAAGPQLAAYTATAGMRTHLVAAQRHESAAALWAACSTAGQSTDVRPGLTVDVRPLAISSVDLTVVLVVVDRREPRLDDLPDDCFVVLALSAGSATAEELARVAMAVDETGKRIHGILVIDPDNLDRTSGRWLQPDRVQQIPLPTRLTGTPASRPPRDGRSTARRRSG